MGAPRRKTGLSGGIISEKVCVTDSVNLHGRAARESRQVSSTGPLLGYQGLALFPSTITGSTVRCILSYENYSRELVLRSKDTIQL